MECDEFQIASFVANSSGGTQCESNFRHGGFPIDWKNPFATHAMPSTVMSTVVNAAPSAPPETSAARTGPNPNTTFANVASARPPIKNQRGRLLSEIGPATNLPTPYTTPCNVRNNPSDVFVMP